MLKKILIALVVLVVLGIAGFSALVYHFSANLPETITMEDFKPQLVSQVFDRDGKRIGEFFRERRIFVPYEKIPKKLVQAFLAAEDDQFFEHGGVNPIAIFRAAIANFKAGRTVQGGSTITQQVAKRLRLSPERTYTRKIKEALLAMRMEKNLTKENILSIYLNEIYLGSGAYLNSGAYGVEAAAQIYFRKHVGELTLAEMAILAGLPQAPSGYSPVRNPAKAKERQKYVLQRMVDVGFIKQDEYDQATKDPVTVYLKPEYEDVAPYYLETVRQLLVAELGETMVLDKGLRIYTGLDADMQTAAQKELREGLREVDKRQGFHGALENITEPEKIEQFLLDTRKEMVRNKRPFLVIAPDGTVEDLGPLDTTRLTPVAQRSKENQKISVLPDYVTIGEITKGIVTRVDDKWGLVHVRFAEGVGLIDVETMTWARKPNPDIYAWQDQVKRPSQALKKGDVILVRVTNDKFSSSHVENDLAKLKSAQGKNYVRPKELPEFDEVAYLRLEQEPLAQASLISFDQKTEEILALVGGYDFEKSEFNRALQAARQTGSSFKAIVYASALDHGYTPATPIIDAPLVYFDENEQLVEGQEGATAPVAEHQEDKKAWKPTNHSKKFGGDILFRNALIRSLNVPTVKIIEDLGVPWVVDYAHRLGVFSPLNMDFTLALGTSGLTLYEMTKVFSQFGRMGKRIHPLIIHRVEDQTGKVIVDQVSLDRRFKGELSKLDAEIEKIKEKQAADREMAAEKQGATDLTASDDQTEGEEEKKNYQPNFFFNDPDQLLSPKTSYLITSLLRSAVAEPGGTGGRARALGREVAAKTGTTNGYYDAWFIGYTPQISTGVWVGFDDEKSLGRGFVGGNTALPIWLEYMKAAHDGLPNMSFPIPDGIVFANIDKETGKLASASSTEIVRQAFAEGSEPTASSSVIEDKADFFKEDLSE